VPKRPTEIGRYQLVDQIGQGGMGSLFLAWDPVLERQIAIKLLRDDSDELRERFAREARSVARLRHPNIVTVFDVGEQDGQPFIAMEYIQGQTVADLIRGGAPLGLARKLELIEDLCSGLGFAHKAGIVHRDVKPANIMVERDGVLKILDFGIARIAESGMTQAGMLIGTLNYMSPEQVAGQVVDGRSDIFAVGAVLYEFITSQQAFPGGLHNGILNRILNEPPKPVEELCPGLDAEIGEIVGRALAKKPEDRYQDLAAMRKQLEAVRRRLETAPAAASQADAETLAIQASEITAPRTPVGATHRQGLARRRATQIAAHLESANRALDVADFDGAAAAAEQVLLLDPDEPSALDILDRARAAIAERQLQDLLRNGKELLDKGSLTQAMAVAEEALTLAPGSAVAIAFQQSTLQAQAERQQAAARAQRQEEERRTREKERREKVAAALARAKVVAAHTEAIELLQQALELAPEDADVQEQLAARRAALAREEEEAQQARELAAKVAAALREAETTAAHAAAIAILERAQQVAPSHGGIQEQLKARRAALAREEEEARQVRERAAAIAASLREAETTTAHAAAIAILERAQRLEPDHAGVREQLASRRAALAREEEEARQARERAAAIAAALHEAEATTAHAAAIAILERAQRVDPGHGGVQEQLKVRRAALAREEEEARQARERAAAIAAALREAEATSAHAAAIAILERAQRVDPGHGGVQEQLKVRRAALARQEEEARQARERAAATAAALREAEATTAHAAAIAILERAQRRDPGDGRLQEQLTARRAALSREEEDARRQRERAAQIAGALADARKAPSHEAAIQILQRALTLEPANSEVQQQLAARRSAYEQQLEEARRKKERDQQIASALKQAKRANSDDAAIGILTNALELDPSHRELKAQLEQRRAASQRAAEEARRDAELRTARQEIGQLIDRGELDAAEIALSKVEQTFPERVRSLKDVRRQLAQAHSAARKATAAEGVPSGRISRGVRPAHIGAAAAVLLLMLAGAYMASRVFDDTAPDLQTAGAGQPTETGNSPEAGRPPAPDPISVTGEANAAPPPVEANAADAAAPATVQPSAPLPTAPDPATIAGRTAAPSDLSAAAVQRGRQQMARGNLEGALSIATDALRGAPQDAALVAFVEEVVASARRQAGEARATAIKSNGTNTGRRTFQDGQRRLNEAGGHERARRPVMAVRAFMDAAALFTRARIEGDSERERLAADARAAAPAPQPAATPPVRPSGESQPQTPPNASGALVSAGSGAAPSADSSTAPVPAAASAAPASVPAPAAAPPAVTPPPPSARGPSDEEGIRLALRAYEAAYNALDVAAVRRIYPSINAAALSRSFSALATQEVRVTPGAITVSGTTATVRAQVRQSFTPRRGIGRSDVIDSEFHLQKVGDRWLILERR
jgi:serine/threonine-protein kinase